MLRANLETFERCVSAAATFWRSNLPSRRDSGWIIVEAMHNQPRTLVRNLTLANAVRRMEPVRLLVIVGTDDRWGQAVWQDAYWIDRIERLCRAFGADEIVNAHDLAGRFSAAEPPPIEVADLRLRPERLGEGVAPWSAIAPVTLDAVADATLCRLERVPRREPRHADAYEAGRIRAGAFAGVYETLFRQLRPIALVTSHVDYDQWGLAVEAAMRQDVPVLYPQGTGSMKAYALFPETRRGEPTFRAELTHQIGDFFEEHVWANRRALRPAAELVAWRCRSNLGRPSWWRRDAAACCDLQNSAQRRQFRAYTMERLGFDPELPVVTVFNHAVSDALGTNREIFADLADWFTQTVAHAERAPAANWLFLDHPRQLSYDSTHFFAALADRHASSAAMVFKRSQEVSKNALWSMTDLGVTVRGSISNELPAFGIPVIQAGWSEWSACGLSQVADDADDYWKTLDVSIERLTRGESLITPDQVERARLWLWFYRSLADVPGPFVPHWNLTEDQFWQVLEANMQCVESDADPVFTAVERMWRRREPFLTRYDLGSAPHGGLGE